MADDIPFPNGRGPAPRRKMYAAPFGADRPALGVNRLHNPETEIEKTTEKKIEEIVYEVEAGQMLPWMAAKRLIGLFRRRKATDLSEKARKDSVHESAVS